MGPRHGLPRMGPMALGFAVFMTWLCDPRGSHRTFSGCIPGTPEWGSFWEEFKPLFLGGLMMGWPSKTEVTAGFERLLVSLLLNSHEASIYGGIFAPHLNGWFLG